MIRLGMRSDYVQPLWMGVTIIIDEVTGSGKGEIEVTAVLLTNTKILRAAGFLQAAVAVSPRPHHGKITLPGRSPRVCQRPACWSAVLMPRRESGQRSR